jgi:hypothetical protein
VWVFASLPDLLRITRVVAAVVTPLVVVVAVRYNPGVPRLVLLLQPLLLAIYAGGRGRSTAPGRSSTFTAPCAPWGSR